MNDLARRAGGSKLRALVSIAAVVSTLFVVLGAGVPGGAAAATAAPNIPQKIVKPSFASSKYTYAGQATPRQYQVADFDNDGNLDIAEAIIARAGAHVLLGDGRGHFGQPVITPLPSAGSPYWIATADFDGDGNQDVAALVISDANYQFRILLGKGDGTFKVGENLGYVSGKVRAGDLNEDGKPDLIVDDMEAADASDRQQVWINKGHGTFKHTVDYTFGGDDLQLGDVNGDTHLDMVWSFGALYARLGNGDGTFDDLIQNFDQQHRLGGPDLALADFNEDGNLDVATDAASDGSVVISLGDGAGHFAFSAEYGDLAYETISIAAADFTGDGHVDVVTSGDFNFGGVEDVFTLLDGKGNGKLGRTTRWVSGGHGLTTADLNEDGRVDLVSDNDYLLLTFITLNAGKGFFDVAQSYTTQAISTEMLQGDLNNDGRPDLVLPYGGSLESHLNDKGRRFLPQKLSFGQGGQILGFDLGDLNGDGNLDAVAGTFPTNNVESFLGDGSGAFHVKQVRNNGSNSAVISLAIDDVTGDGKADVVSNTVGQLSVLPGKGDGTFGNPMLSGQAGPIQVRTLLADVTGDGELDTISVVSSGDDVATSAIFLNRGDGHGAFTLIKTLTIDSNASGAAVGDLDGNDSLDLAVVGQRGPDGGRQGLFVFLTAGGVLGTPAYYAEGENDVALADFNGDGSLDVATTCVFGDCPNDAQFSVYPNRGDGSLVSPVRFLPAHFSYRVAAAMFTNDAKPDVVLLTPSGPRSEFALYVNTTRTH